MKKRLTLTVLLILAFSVLLSATGYHLLYRSNRFWDNDGILSTDNRLQTVGASNALRLAYSDGVYTDLTQDSNGVIQIAKDMASGDSSKIINLDATPTLLTGGIRQGVLYVGMDRTSGYVLTASDGNSDTGVKIQVTNRTASEDYWRGRGLDVLVQERDGTAGAYFMEGAYIAVKNRSGNTMNAAGYMTALKAETNHNATGACEVIGINVNDITQSSTASALYGVKITTGAYAITRTHAFYVSSAAGSWTNGISFNDTITNAFDFENTDGTNAAGYNAAFSVPAAYAVPDGYIKVDIGGTTQYIYTWTVLPIL